MIRKRRNVLAWLLAVSLCVPMNVYAEGADNSTEETQQSV